MQFNDRAEIKGFRATADGYLVGEVLCARTGCQDYYAGEMGLDMGRSGCRKKAQWCGGSTI